MVILTLGSTGRWPVVRGSLPRTAWNALAIFAHAFGTAAECHTLAVCAPQP